MEQWPGKACTETCLLLPQRAFVPLMPTLSFHTTQRQKLTLRGPLTQVHLLVSLRYLSAPLGTKQLLHGLRFLRRRSLEAPLGRPPPSASVPLRLVPALK